MCDPIIQTLLKSIVPLWEDKLFNQFIILCISWQQTVVTCVKLLFDQMNVACIQAKRYSPKIHIISSKIVCEICPSSERSLLNSIFKQSYIQPNMLADVFQVNIRVYSANGTRRKKSYYLIYTGCSFDILRSMSLVCCCFILNVNLWAKFANALVRNVYVVIRYVLQHFKWFQTLEKYNDDFPEKMLILCEFKIITRWEPIILPRRTHDFCYFAWDV